MVFDLVPSYFVILTPLVGFFAGMMFGALSLFVTSFVKTINHFNFFLTGCLTPMFFFGNCIPYHQSSGMDSMGIRSIPAHSFRPFDPGLLFRAVQQPVIL